jgi:hypothetical protein
MGKRELPQSLRQYKFTPAFSISTEFARWFAARSRKSNYARPRKLNSAG